MRRTICLTFLLLSCPLVANAQSVRRLTSGGKSIAEKELEAKVRNARVIYVGEEHGNAKHHRLQRDILEMMAKAGPAVLGVEYFPRSLQPVLDKFNSGEISLKDFPKAIQWKKVWGHPYSVYEPLFRLCHERKIRVVALNAERSVVKKVRRKGLKDGFSVEDLLMFPRMDLRNEAHKERIHKALLKVHPMPKSMLDHFYQAFTLWDETMAESTANVFLRDRREGLRVLVVAGRAHISHGTGIPDRVKRRTALTRLTVLCDSSGKAEPGFADVLYFSEPKAKRKARLY
ncbi:MAG: ChaN family lipoprotein [Planctomycetota bacterium]|nr:ChaN family lipoprotein [Planctomycetota bacterium]